jgi:hypothetical protein
MYYRKKINKLIVSEKSNEIESFNRTKMKNIILKI